MSCLLHQFPKFYDNVFLFVGLATLGLQWILIGLINTLYVEMFQPLIIINKRYDFVYHHIWCTSIIGHCRIPLATWFLSLKFLWSLTIYRKVIMIVIRVNWVDRDKSIFSVVKLMHALLLALYLCSLLLMMLSSLLTITVQFYSKFDIRNCFLKNFLNPIY